MKRALSVVLTMALLFSSISMMFTVSTSALPVNLVTNGDFSTIAGGSFTSDVAVGGITYPGHILAYAAGCNWYRATGGNTSAFDAYYTEGTNTYGVIAQNIGQIVKLQSNTTYSMSFKAKSDSPWYANKLLSVSFNDKTTTTSNIAAALPAGNILSDESGNVTASSAGYVYATLGTAWQTYSITFTTGTLSATDDYYLFMSAAGYDGANIKYWYLDDVNISVFVPDYTPVAGNGNFETPTANTNDLAKISADGNCLDGVAGHSDVATSRIGAKPSPITDGVMSRWYRPTDGAVQSAPGGTNAYTAIVQEAGNPTNHIAKVGQTLLQGVYLNTGGSYTLTFSMRLKSGFTVPVSNSYYDMFFQTAAASGTATGYSLNNTTLSYSYMNDSGVLQKSSAGLSLSGASTIRINLSTINSTLNSRWVTFTYKFDLASTTFTTNTIAVLTFGSSNWSTTDGNASNFFEYMDNISFGNSTKVDSISSDFEDGVGSANATDFTTDLNVVPAAASNAPAACGNYVGSFSTPTAYTSTTSDIGFDVVTGNLYKVGCWFNIASATGFSAGNGASIGVANIKDSFGSSLATANSYYTVLDATGAIVFANRKGGGLGGKTFCSLAQETGITTGAWYYMEMTYCAPTTERVYFMIRTDNITNATLLIDNVSAKQFSGHNTLGIIGSAVRGSSNGVPQGMRTTSSIPISTITNSAVVEFGTVAIRTARFTGELTLTTPNAAHGASYIKGDAVLNTPVIRYDNHDTTTYWFAAVLTNIPVQYYSQDYTTRSYAKTGSGYYIYGDAVTRSVYDVVYIILNTAPVGSIDYTKAMNIVNEDPTAYNTWVATDPHN